MKFAVDFDNFQHLPNGGIKLDISAEFYSRAAIVEASYRFTDRCYVDIVTANKGIVEVHIHPKQDAINLDVVAKDFLNELIDQQLRNRIRCETQEIRETIIKEAFAPLENVPKFNHQESGA